MGHFIVRSYVSLLSESSLLDYYCVHRCPTTRELGIMFFNVDRLNWGFQFYVPKFDGHDELFVVCDALTCEKNQSDQEKDATCDRSCTVDVESWARQMKRSLGVVDQPMKESQTPVSPLVKSDTEEAIRGGPFVIKDDGVGPLITGEQQLLVIHRSVSVVMNSQSKCADTRLVVVVSLYFMKFRVFHLLGGWVLH
jgi:hypothetical protein